MDTAIESYLNDVRGVLQRDLGDGLVALWPSGSLATSDFRPGASDVDLLAVSRQRLPEEIKRRLVRGLCHSALPCPALGLDLLLYREPEVRSARRAPRYELSIASGAEWEDDVSLGGEYPGGVLDLALVRRHGRSLVGPPPEALVPPVPAAWVAEELARTLRWHGERVHHPFHDPTGTNAVLNACRALRFRAEGVLVSKSDGAVWLLDRRPAPVVEAALASRKAGSRRPLDRAQVLLFLEDAIARFSAGTG